MSKSIKLKQEDIINHATKSYFINDDVKDNLALNLTNGILSGYSYQGSEYVFSTTAKDFTPVTENDIGDTFEVVADIARYHQGIESFREKMIYEANSNKTTTDLQELTVAGVKAPDVPVLVSNHKETKQKVNDFMAGNLLYIQSKE